MLSRPSQGIVAQAKPVRQGQDPPVIPPSPGQPAEMERRATTVGVVEVEPTRVSFLNLQFYHAECGARFRVSEEKVWATCPRWHHFFEFATYRFVCEPCGTRFDIEKDGSAERAIMAVATAPHRETRIAYAIKVQDSSLHKGLDDTLRIAIIPIRKIIIVQRSGD